MFENPIDHHQISIEQHAEATLCGSSNTLLSYRVQDDEKLCFTVVDQEIMAVLQKYGNNPNGWPALHYAIHVNDVKAVGILLKYGADPNVRTISSKKTKNPETIPGPLDLAIVKYHIDSIPKPKIVDLLLKAGANPYDFDVNNTSAIGQAIFGYINAYVEGDVSRVEKYSEILQIFATHGIDWNRHCIQYREGRQSNPYTKRTPLWFAIDFKCNELVQFLLEHGAILGDV